METKKIIPGEVSKARGSVPAFYRDHKSTAPTFHHDRRKVDEPRFAKDSSRNKKECEGKPLIPSI